MQFWPTGFFFALTGTPVDLKTQKCWKRQGHEGTAPSNKDWKRLRHKGPDPSNKDWKRQAHEGPAPSNKDWKSPGPCPLLPGPGPSWDRLPPHTGPKGP